MFGLEDELYEKIHKLEQVIDWATSKDAVAQSLHLPRGCSPMNGPERITAEICIENLQAAIRRRAKEVG